MKFDLFAEASRQHKCHALGDLLQVVARHTDFHDLARLWMPPLSGASGPAIHPTEIRVRILVLRHLCNLSDEQMEYQLLDRVNWQRVCLQHDAMNVPDRNTIWRFGERRGVDGAWWRLPKAALNKSPRCGALCSGDGLQGASRSNSRSYCEDWQRSRPPSAEMHRARGLVQRCPKPGGAKRPWRIGLWPIGQVPSRIRGGGILMGQPGGWLAAAV